MMTRLEHRDGEAGNLPIRSDRFFSAQGNWYFSTREGTPVGPFDDKEEAKDGLDNFIEFMQLAEPKTLTKLYCALTR